MAIISLSTPHIFDKKWGHTNQNHYFRAKPTLTLKPGVLKVGNTYVMIFSMHQEEEYLALMSIPNLKVLYQSIPAVNLIHRGPPRIFVVVFEPQAEVAPHESSTQPLPTLQN
jgi:hypothetical protein